MNATGSAHLKARVRTLALFRHPDLGQIWLV